MKRFLTVAVAMLALTGMGQVAMRKLEDLTNTNLVCVTDYGPQLVSVTGGLASISGAVAVIQSALPGLATTQSVVSVNGQTGAVVVTAAQIGALTNELDLAALRTYHYGSPDIVESPAEWFVFEAGTITEFNWAAGRTNVVIPWAIGGVPVTAIGADAFRTDGIVSVIAPQTVTTIGDYAFYFCTSLTSVSLPQVQTVGDSAFNNCESLTSVSLPQAQTVGTAVFEYCISLTSVSLPQAQTVGTGAFYFCTSLTSVYFYGNAPAEATDVFYDITPPPTVYVTDPQATGWGDTWNGAPVVRPPLYGSNVTAQAFTLGGDTITEWPSGGETGIIKPVVTSATNVVVTSTQSVYSVSVTDAGPVGIDWSGLGLDGTGRAEITLRLNVADWGGTNVSFASSMTFDTTPEILVTGVWEFACSTIDGVTAIVKQTWPECCGWREIPCTLNQSYSGVNALFNAKTWATYTAIGVTNYLTYLLPANDSYLIRNRTYGNGPNIPPTYMEHLVLKRGHAHQVRIPIYTTTKLIKTYAGEITESYFVFPADPTYKFFELALVTGEPFASSGLGSLYAECTYVRRLNSNERAAYEAGWRP